MLNGRQAWLLVHIGLGSVCLHSFLGGARSLLDQRNRPGLDRARVRTSMMMAAAAWLTVLTGTWGVYVWYRATPAPGASALDYPKAWLVGHADLARWHDFGMEWKEHVGWLAPILATTVAVMVVRHHEVLRADWRSRRLVAALFSMAFAALVIAAVLGAVINKVAPNQFLSL